MYYEQPQDIQQQGSIKQPPPAEKTDAAQLEASPSNTNTIATSLPPIEPHEKGKQDTSYKH